ncbi:MAG: 30S ribosome-binding factor RbfA [Hyphomicrobiaceae bacterium]|nr:30S ribosome-binding factor RbfA [Hyphomicrobiaceae bacterium]MCC0007935.1 30S ribosome-binding factor RbfA [Hyphomicrobiaceae bacterium]
MPRRDHSEGAAKGPSQRQLRVGETIRHALAELLVRGEIHDDTIASHVITVTEVRMSPDLKLATAYIMPLGGADLKPVLAALDRNRKYIRSVVAHAVNLKFAPDIRFREDETFEEAMRIERLLHSPKVRQDLEKADEADDNRNE